MSTKLTAADALAWLDVGMKLITVLSVPVAAVIALMRQQGVDDATIDALAGQWTSLLAQIDARIAALKAETQG